MGVFLLTLAVVFNSIANALFKYASGISDFGTQKIALLGIGLAIGLANTLCYIKALDEIDLGVAYPVFSAASIILIAALSGFFFREAISLQKAAGLAVICVGILLLWKA